MKELITDLYSRPDKDAYFLLIALSVSRRSTCIRRRFGAIIVKNDIILGTGYNGNARGVVNCINVGCTKNELNLPSFSNYDLCPAVHAEENAIINSNRDDRMGSTMYVAGYNSDDSLAVATPCNGCRRRIMNSLISRIVIVGKDGNPQDVEISKWADDDSKWYADKFKSVKKNKGGGDN